MTLARHLAQGQLLYFSQQADAMSVSENAHLRWLAFDGVLQSVVRKQRPHWLTLPHHWALLMPWLYYTPSKVVEFGLGGGNHLLFHHWLTSEIEQSSHRSQRSGDRRRPTILWVISLYQTYPSSNRATVVNRESNARYRLADIRYLSKAESGR